MDDDGSQLLRTRKESARQMFLKRKWYILAGALTVVAVGVGVGVALSSSDGGDSAPSPSISSQGTEGDNSKDITAFPTNPPIDSSTPPPAALSMATTETPSATSNNPLTTSPSQNSPTGSPAKIETPSAIPAPTITPNTVPTNEPISEPTPAPSTSEPTDEPISHPTKSPIAAERSEVFDTLKEFALMGGSEFDVENSFQQKALLFVERTYLQQEHSANRLVQRYALACIFFATSQVETRYTEIRFEIADLGPWTDATGWLDTEDECTWKGVVCDNQGRVTELNLGNNVLSGTFPEEAKLLSNLLVLDLSGNHCFNSGSKENDWIGDMTTLQYLYLTRSPFLSTNGIPTAFNNLVNLIELDLSNTLYSGALASDLFEGMDQLFVLTLDGNSYNSSIPLTIGRLPSLSYVYASRADIIGDLSFFQSPDLWPNLIEIWMDNNPRLIGELPTDLGGYSNIRSLSFADCGLSGSLPESIGDLADLQKFWVYGNKLSGAVPSSISNYRKLLYFQIEDNDLTGVVPDIVGLVNVGIVNLHADCPDEVICNQCTCCGPECKLTPLR